MNTISHASDRESPIISIVDSNLDGSCISIVVKNNTVKDIYLASWDLMKSGELTKDVFVITSSDGAQFQYKGKLVKRAEPSIDDLQIIKAGQSYAVKVDLSKYYTLRGEIKKIVYDTTIPVYELTGDIVQVDDFEVIEAELYLKE